ANAAASDVVDLTASALGSELGTFKPITYLGTGATPFAGSVRLMTGTGANVIHVQSTAASAPVVVQTGNGNNSVFVSDTTNGVGDVATIKGALAVVAGTGANYLQVSELTDPTAHDGTLVTNNLVGSPAGRFAPISYQGSFGSGIAVLGSQQGS